MAVYDQWHRAPRPGDQPCEHSRGKAALYPARRHGTGDRWQVRWRDPEGRQQKRNFARRAGADPNVHADAFDAMIAEQLRTRTYADPAAAETTLQAYAEQWRKGRGHDVNRAAAVEGHLRCHVYPDPAARGRTPKGGIPIGQHPLGLLARRPSLVQGWIQAMPLAEGSKRQVAEVVSAVFRAAVDDGVIGRNPLQAASVDRPSPGPVKARPWSAERVAAVRDALPGRYRIIPELGAGTGMRQGEMFGLADTDVQFLGRRPAVTISRQVTMIGGELRFAPVKNRKPHAVPLSPQLGARLSAHLARYPAREVTLPWHEPKNRELHGAAVTARLVLTAPRGGPVRKQDFDRRIWRTALAAAGVTPARQDGCHALRHTFASVQLRAHVDIVRVAAWLGDTVAVVARTYAHLLPDDDDSDGRAATDAFLASCAPDVPPAEDGGTPAQVREGW